MLAPMISLFMLAVGPVDALSPDKAKPEQLCTADKSWCVELRQGDDLPGLIIDAAGQQRTVPLPALPDEIGFSTSLYSLWPSRIPLSGAGASLVGVIRQDRIMYSGGGAHSGTLTLYRTMPGADMVEVLTVPWDSGSLIRACFSEKDFRQRRGVCHDEYAYSAQIGVVAGSAGDLPDLRYTTDANSFPGAVSRSADSLAGPRLRKKDIVRVTNAECSFTRVFRYDPQARRYVPDQPLPDCGDYTGL